MTIRQFFIQLCGCSNFIKEFILGDGSYILIEAPRPPRQDGAGTAGLPGIV
jgi:hypothetical protein